MSRSNADKPSADLIDALFIDQVQFKNLTPATQPFVVFVTGVAGSGKSYSMVQVRENASFNVFTIQADDYRKLHPKIKELIVKHGIDNAHQYTGSFSHRTALALRDKVILHRLNVVYEATFGNLDTAKSLIDCFRDNGYRVAVLALPVNLALSIQRNESRYQIKLEDIHTLPRKVSLLDIQKMNDNFINNINELEEYGVNIYCMSAGQNSRLVLRDMIANFQAA